jgi:quercetin dioxygenase-like cupin family protein
MKRKSFLTTAFAFVPFSIFALSFKNRNRTNRGFRVNADEARFGVHYKMKGVTLNLLDIKISSKDTDGDIAVFEQNGFTPKGGPPLHIHLYQDEYFYIIQGEYLFQVGDEKFQMKAGETIFLPRNIPHAFVQLTDRGKVLVSYLPAGKMEDFFKTTDSWASAPTKEEIEKAFEDHDMKIVGPPLQCNNF